MTIRKFKDKRTGEIKEIDDSDPRNTRLISFYRRNMRCLEI